MPLKLTARFVETVKGQDRRQENRDTEAKGLILRVMPSGVKSWALLYSHARATDAGRVSRHQACQGA